MKPVIFNQQQRFVRVFLLLAATAGLISAVGGVLAMLSRPANGVPAVFGFLSGVVCITLLICAAFTVPPARRATDMIKRMKAGEALAHWVYPTELWKAWVHRGQRGFGPTTWVAVTSVVAVVGIIVFALLTTSPQVNPSGHRDALIFGVAATLVMSFIFGGMTAYRRRRTKRLLSCGECYLLRDAVYIGGDFVFWDAQMRCLQGARLLPSEGASLAAIELTLGVSPGAARTQRGIGLASLFASGPYVGEYKSVTYIPVPPDGMDDAERIILRWLQRVS